MLFITPVVSQVTRFVAYLAANMAMDARSPVPYYTWDPTTLAYANAIQTMQGRNFPADQTSYDYQAAMHGSNISPKLRY